MPEVLLHVAEEPYGLWEATEDRSGVRGTPPPFWAFPWPGGAALARYLLDVPAVVAGLRVVDVGCGSGLVSLAAARAGAADVLALDLDPLALAATGLNTALNDVCPGLVRVVRADVVELAAAPDAEPLVAALLGAGAVLAGDLFFERTLAAAMLALLRRATTAGCTVLTGDPGRTHLPAGVFTEVATYDVPTSPALEDAPVRRTRVLRLDPGR